MTDLTRAAADLSHLTASEQAELLTLLETQRREEARRSFLAFCIDALAPLGQVPAAHHRLLISKLEAVARGEIKRLLVCMPPGSAKSTYGSKLFPAWYLAQKAGRRVIGAANTASLAEGFSREAMGFAKDMADSLGYQLVRENVAEWSTTNRGLYIAAGVGGNITGHRADLAMIDDPVRNADEVANEEQREKQWRWFTSALRTRLKPGAAIIVIMTRWHEDDLGGRVLARQKGMWQVVSLPAMALANDPLGREPGEFLWGDDSYNYAAELRAAYAEAQISGAMQTWGALYQQDPRPSDGALFKADRIRIEPVALAGAKIERGWDLAATEQVGRADPDFTAGVKMVACSDGSFGVLDVVRMRGAPEEVQAKILQTAGMDGRKVRIKLPQDPGQAGKAQVLDLTKRLKGYAVHSAPVTGDKSTRAAPFASQVNVGNVWMVQAPWNAAFLEELRGFPNMRHDDQVDAAADAFNALTAAPAASKRITLPFIGR